MCVHIPAWEREVEPALVEAKFDAFGQGVLHVSVVGCLDPGADDEVDAALVQFTDGHLWLGVVEEPAGEVRPSAACHLIRCGADVLGEQATEVSGRHAEAGAQLVLLARREDRQNM